jgi:glycosyltransferase involved in cell wall biosynthesis
VVKSRLRHVDLVLCQTDVAAERFAREFHFKGATAVMPNAVSSKIELEKIGTPNVFCNTTKKIKFIYVSLYAPHKNLELIVETFKRYREELLDILCVLTISPENHKDAPRLLQTIKDEGLSDNIISVGNLPQQELYRYYLHADGVLMPSLLESFSGVFVEALKFGVPIVASDLDFARAVCGNAALYFDPFSPASLKETLLLFSNDKTIRQQLIAAGDQQVQHLLKDWQEITHAALLEIEKIPALAQPTAALVYRT